MANEQLTFTEETVLKEMKRMESYLYLLDLNPEEHPEYRDDLEHIRNLYNLVINSANSLQLRGVGADPRTINNLQNMLVMKVNSFIEEGENLKHILQPSEMEPVGA